MNLQLKTNKFFTDSVYTSTELLEFEQQQIFRQTWLYIGRVDELMHSSNVRVIEVAGTSVLLTRSRHGIKAFYNVCPHRAALFRSEPGHYQLKRLVCPYHAWTYNLEGNLIGVPKEERFGADFCRADYSLISIRLEQWQNFVFICFSDEAPALQEFLGRIPRELDKHITSATQLLVQKQYQVQCNWKVYHDNTLCDYHVAVAHRTTLDPIQGSVDCYEHEFDLFVNLLYTPTTKMWRSQNRVLEHLSDRSRQGFFTFGIFPNLHLLALPNGLMSWLRIDPVTVDTSSIHLEIYGVPELISTDVLQEFEAFMAEDIAITEGVQKGYASGVYRSGPVNQLEDRIAHQQQLIWQFLQAGLQRDRTQHPHLAAMISNAFMNSPTFAHKMFS